MKRVSFSLLLIAILGTGFSSGRADDPPKPGPGSHGKSASSKSSSSSHSSSGDLKKYDDVITKDAQTMPGVFAVHRIEDKVYFEIPQSAWGRLMLWQSEVVKGSPGVSWGGMSLGTSFVRWERRHNKVYLWRAAFAKRAEGQAVQKAVDSANMDTIIASFPVEAEGKDRSTVIQATSLFVNDNPDLSVRRAGGSAAGGGIDDARSYLSDVKAFPTNIEIRSLLTFRSSGGGGTPFGGRGGFAAGSNRSVSALVHYSLVMLPEKPMQPRYFDPRVGYFVESFEKYDDPKTWMIRREYIARFRLEKKDPNAAVSEPVQPITFYLSREIPEKWRSYLKKGVEDWRPAFEAAGFKNAIVCREAPERAEDPNWDPEDARYSVIRWVAEPVANAMGPNVHDPRSGEIISAHIIFWHDITRLTQLWYFVQCAAVDEHARKLPFSDALIGDLLRYVACHEVGHTLGLRHNHRASQAYSIAELRDPKFTATHGSVASIMSYGRYNYVAQPEDHVKQLIPILGPYDIFAIEWGYKPIPSAKSAEEEVPTLDTWAARQIKEPFLRFGGEDGPATVDPTVLTENISTDPVAATALGLKNLDRVLGFLVSATTTKGEDFDLLEEAYKSILSHERNWYGAVLKQVGGVIENRKLAGRGGEEFVRVPKERQKESVKFLLEHAFVTPKSLLNPEIVNQFSYNGAAEDIQSQQQALLRNLLGDSRLNRLFDAEILAPDKAYTAFDLVKDVQAGIWSELTSDQPKIDPLRRRLQETYLEIMKSEFESKDGASGTRGRAEGHNSELRAIARVTLAELLVQIDKAISKAKDAATKAHLMDARAEIDSILNPSRK